MITTSRLQVTGVTGGPLRITGASLVNGAYELATAGGADYELQTERQVMLENILFIPGIGFDSDALAYIKAVEEADGQALERGVRNAINQFVRGCKVDGIWDAIKASCILAGARTLSGALIPLKGSAPTNNGPFVSGDYDRKTGLVSNGSTKFLNSNRNNNADPQNSKHLSVYISVSSTTIGALIAGREDAAIESGSSQIVTTNTTSNFRINSSSFSSVAGGHLQPGFAGVSRTGATSLNFRYNSGTTGSATTASEAPANDPIQVFNRNFGPGSNARLAFYSIGESLNLAKLDARVTTLINTFGAVI
jgi:hypothetical protein